MNLQTAYALAETIEAKDRYTQGHCERVRWLSSLIGKAMRLPDEEIEQLEYAALLHDIGKIGIPDSILNKEGPLNEKERQIIRMHPIIGAQILSTVDFSNERQPQCDTITSVGTAKATQTVLKARASIIWRESSRSRTPSMPWRLRGLTARRSVSRIVF